MSLLMVALPGLTLSDVSAATATAAAVAEWHKLHSYN